MKPTHPRLPSPHSSPLIQRPPPRPHSHPWLQPVLGLTCSTCTLFHAQLAAARAWVLAPRLLRRPTVGLALAAAARRSGSSHPQRSGSDNRGCQPPGRAVRSAPSVHCSHTRSPSTATGRGAAGSPGRAQARTRTEAPSPAGKPTPTPSLPRGTRRPNLGSRRQQTLLPHPLIFTVTRPPSNSSLHRL